MNSTRDPVRPVREGWAQVLIADADLAARLPTATVAAARPFLVAPVLWLEPGHWRPDPPPRDHRSTHLGLLVLDGFLVRRVDVLVRPVTELLGRGDLLVPWEAECTEPFAARSAWEVIEPARVAVLDQRFAALANRWPDVTAALVARAVSRSRALTVPPRSVGSSAPSCVCVRFSGISQGAGALRTARPPSFRSTSRTSYSQA